jgi:hypothetical protein
MGCCQSAGASRGRKSQRSRAERVSIVVEGVSEVSERAKGFREVWNNPEGVFERRDVRRCFKGVGGEEKVGVGGVEKGEGRMVLIVESQ